VDRYEEGWNAEGVIGELMRCFQGQRPDDLPAAFAAYRDARYLRTGGCS
jgi:hypothetical protein